ncbi:TolC family protein [Pontibacter sp. SGAir0037]|uniref:TolC family protein n=1 Tax=Pontibacter sp. SGAir0037 TaxID=2571030 RepID=UPI0010CCCC3E|nr:TolC family protein [Pontibacter sp. SGAir0037]QCR21772.1 TolC family protein [Pontibacter sp. SGAir0037]
MKIINRVGVLLTGCMLVPCLLVAQSGTGEVPGNLTLEQCVEYALKNRAAVEQAAIDETIGDREINASLSGWLPQVNASFGGTHNIKLQQQPFGDQIVTLGQKYTSNFLVEANQSIFSSELLLASKAARFRREQLDQNSLNTKINTVVDVSKAFYDILLSQEQIRILNENLSRQEKQYQDARSRFEVGLVDKTDYQRAAITLANIRSDRKRAQETIKAKQALLKQLMGFPVESDLNLTYEYENMQREVLIDTTAVPDFANRIELRLLQTQRELLRLNTSYSRWSLIPTISAYVNYNWLFFNNEFSELYSRTYPTSSAGLRVAIPVFQGTRRIQNIKIAELQEQRADIGIADARKAINTEYQAALASYKSSYNDWITLRDNLQLAQEVYEIIRLQYDEGVKAYVDLIIAETDLRTTQLNYYNALFNVLASKLDYQRAIGTIDVN